MKKLIFYASAFSLLMFAGCSSEDDNTIGSGTGSGSSSSLTTLTTVVSSGVKQIPLTVTEGTAEVTVKYKADGQEKEVKVPFTATGSSANSSLVSGYATLISSTPAVVDVYSDTTLLAEGVRLTGRNVTYGDDLITDSDDEVQYEKANFYIRLDGNIQGAEAQPAGSYYPQNANGTSYIGELNEGTIQVSGNETLWKTLDSGTRYIFSSDGSATAAVLTQIPDYTKFGVDIDTDKQKVIWYVVKKEHGRWHVDGVVVDKETTSVDVSGDGGSSDEMEDTKLPTLPDTPDDVTDPVGTIYYKGGVMMYESDGDGDYNDLVVDYDVEANFPADEAKSPYIRVVMHLRALSDKNLDKVTIEMTGMENYVCPNDDMYITFHGINIADTPHYTTEPAYNIPDFRNCGLQPGTQQHTCAEVSGLQWILTNGTKGWFDLDGNGYYNVTQESFNDKPFATVEITFYPDKEVTDVEAEVAKVISQIEQSFKFNGADGDYIIAPVGTPHAIQGVPLKEAFPNYGVETQWWEEFEDDVVININRGYSDLD